MDEPTNWRVMHRQIELALVNEELIKAYDLIQSGVKAYEELLAASLADAAVNDPDGELAGWDDEAQIAYRKKVHGQTLYRALFVSSWGTLEQLLRDLCKDFKENFGLTLSERDLSDRGVRRSMKYIRKVARLDVDLNAARWSRVLKYGKLRNHFAHVGSNADEARNPRKARSEFSELPHVEIEPAGEIVLDPDFVPELIGDFNRLLSAVFKGAAERKTRGTSDGAKES